MNLRPALIAAVSAIIGLCLYYDITTIIEFYGSGPPYYARTTNMDKWSDPLPHLVIVNLVGFAVVVAVLVFTRKRGR